MFSWRNKKNIYESFIHLTWSHADEQNGKGPLFLTLHQLGVALIVFQFLDAHADPGLHCSVWGTSVLIVRINYAIALILWGEKAHFLAVLS